MHTSIARRLAVITALGCGMLFATTAAQASNVHWSVGISAPIYPAHVNTVISNGPYYAPPPVYVRPAPVYYYAPPPVYYRPAPPPHQGYWHGGHHDHRWHDRGHRGHHWHDRGHDRGGYHHNGRHHDRHDGWRR